MTCLCVCLVTTPRALCELLGLVRALDRPTLDQDTPSYISIPPSYTITTTITTTTTTTVTTTTITITTTTMFKVVSCFTISYSVRPNVVLI